jgi:hypothetical protein
MSHLLAFSRSLCAITFNLLHGGSRSLGNWLQNGCKWLLANGGGEHIGVGARGNIIMRTLATIATAVVLLIALAIPAFAAQPANPGCFGIDRAENNTTWIMDSPQQGPVDGVTKPHCAPTRMETGIVSTSMDARARHNTGMTPAPARSVTVHSDWMPEMANSAHAMHGGVSV